MVRSLNTASAVDNRNTGALELKTIRQNGLNTASAVDNRNTKLLDFRRTMVLCLNTASAVDNRNKELVLSIRRRIRLNTASAVDNRNILKEVSEESYERVSIPPQR